MEQLKSSPQLAETVNKISSLLHSTDYLTSDELMSMKSVIVKALNLLPTLRGKDSTLTHEDALNLLTELRHEVCEEGLESSSLTTMIAKEIKGLEGNAPGNQTSQQGPGISIITNMPLIDPVKAYSILDVVLCDQAIVNIADDARPLFFRFDSQSLSYNLVDASGMSSRHWEDFRFKAKMVTQVIYEGMRIIIFCDICKAICIKLRTQAIADAFLRSLSERTIWNFNPVGIFDKIWEKVHWDTHKIDYHALASGLQCGRTIGSSS